MRLRDAIPAGSAYLELTKPRITGSVVFTAATGLWLAPVRVALPLVAREYYQLLADQVDVRGTTASDDFELDVQANGSVDVVIRARDERTDHGTPFFRRTFVPGETSEIRLYTMGGHDRIRIAGQSDRAIPIHTVRPHDLAADSSRRFEPSAAARYASLGAPAAAGESPRADPQDLARKQYETFRDWGRDWLFYPRLSYDSTRGLVAGTLAERTAYGRELDSFASEMGFGAEWSTGTNRPRLEYNADLRTRSRVRALVYVAYSGIDVVKFYGTGNESARTPSLLSSGFYDVRQELVVANPVLEIPLGGPVRGRLGALFKHASSVQDSGILAGRPEGTGGMTLASAEAGVVVDTRTGTFPGRSGLSFHMTARHTPKVFSNPAA